jgi:hypothetical protein
MENMWKCIYIFCYISAICIEMIVLLSELWYTHEFCAFILLYKDVLHTCVFILKKDMEKVFIN